MNTICHIGHIGRLRVVISPLPQTTPYLQQCVKMSVQAQFEWFFIMTERISDQHSWLYVHQTKNTLCLHRLDQSGREDEIGICAEDLESMEDLGKSISELYVCTNYIRDEKKVRIMVGRPNYNSRDLESATIVISASILVDELKHEGPPQYYSIASGQEDVIVKNMYLTNLDRVVCTGRYVKVVEERATTLYQSGINNGRLKPSGKFWTSFFYTVLNIRYVIYCMCYNLYVSLSIVNK